MFLENGQPSGNPGCVSGPESLTLRIKEKTRLHIAFMVHRAPGCLAIHSQILLSKCSGGEIGFGHRPPVLSHLCATDSEPV